MVGEQEDDSHAGSRRSGRASHPPHRRVAGCRWIARDLDRQLTPWREEHGPGRGRHPGYPADRSDRLATAHASLRRRRSLDLVRLGPADRPSRENRSPQPDPSWLPPRRLPGRKRCLRSHDWPADFDRPPRAWAGCPHRGPGSEARAGHPGDRLVAPVRASLGLTCRRSALGDDSGRDLGHASLPNGDQRRSPTTIRAVGDRHARRGSEDDRRRRGDRLVTERPTSESCLDDPFERREWDSNPRGPRPHGFSRAAHSSALPSLPVESQLS